MAWGLIMIGAVLAFLPIALRLLGLIRAFSVPTTAMSPAVSAGDHIFAEGFTYLSRKPRRGDIAVFKSDGILALPPSIYVKRIIGEPGDHVELIAGNLFINGAKTTLTNAYGEISFQLLPGPQSMSATTNIIVPKRSYFVMGDNSTNSFDSRFFGAVPAKNIIGRVAVCFWPLTRVDVVQ
jgi:signal peptidase I